MRSRASMIGSAVGFGLVLMVVHFQAQSQQGQAEAEWSLNMTAIEACSCPMFCQCYFNTEPAAHGGHAHSHDDGEHEHFCRFNMAWRVNSGHWGETRLDDALFWVAGDLGSEWADGTMDWFVIHFDPAVTDAQREAIQNILARLFPVEWDSADVGRDAPIHWEATADRAVARLADGDLAEVVLERFPGMTDDPIVIHNLPYWGAPRNEGFVLMPNQVQALHEAPEGKSPFEFNNSNGFMITVDINADDVAADAED